MMEEHHLVSVAERCFRLPYDLSIGVAYCLASDLGEEYKLVRFRDYGQCFCWWESVGSGWLKPPGQRGGVDGLHVGIKCGNQFRVSHCCSPNDDCHIAPRPELLGPVTYNR